MVNHQPTPASQPVAATSTTGRALHIQRRLFHMAGASAFPVLALFLDEGLFLTLLLVVTWVFVLGDLTRLRVRRLNSLFHRLFHPLLRQVEVSRVTGASYVLLGTLGAFVLFPQDVAILAVLFTALGDPVAAMVGTRCPGRRLSGKSPWGTAAMIAVGLGVAAVLHTIGAIGFRWPVAVGAVASGVTELLPLPLDDNLRVPLVAGAVMAFLGM